MYSTIAGLLELAEGRGVPLWNIALENETVLTGRDEDGVFDELERRYRIMCASATRALTQPLPTAGGLITGIAGTQYAFAKKGNGIGGDFINLVMARALSCSEVNAAMGRICAAPTAGACGVLPAVLITVGEKYALSRREILQALLTASGVGAVIMKNATVSGAEGGCQAECGVAAAMAAAAAVQMAGGTNLMAVNSICFALMNCMGLICDPVAGLVQIPCAQRNASQAVNAILSADLALGGMTSVIPPDEIIESMAKVGRMLPTPLRETAMGGVAVTSAGKDAAKRIFGDG